MAQIPEGSVGRSAASVLVQVIVWAVCGCAIGAAAGLLFGLLFGVISALAHAEWWRLVWFPLYFARCGAAAGWLVGVVRATCDRRDEFDWADEGSTGALAAGNFADLKTNRIAALPPSCNQNGAAASRAPHPAKAGNGRWYSYLKH